MFHLKDQNNKIYFSSKKLFFALKERTKIAKEEKLNLNVYQNDQLITKKSAENLGINNLWKTFLVSNQNLNIWFPVQKPWDLDISKSKTTNRFLASPSKFLASPSKFKENYSSTDNKLVIIDAKNILYRYYYSNSKRNDNNNIVFNLIEVLEKIQSKWKPSHLCLVFDTENKNFRHKIYDQYKSTRKSHPDELIDQIQLCRRFCKDFCIPYIIHNDAECDDVIASLCEKFHSEFDRIIITSNDKDLIQCLEKNIILYDLFRKEIKDHDELWKNYGIKYSQNSNSKNNIISSNDDKIVQDNNEVASDNNEIIPDEIDYSLLRSRFIDFMSLCGDSSDNIPGLQGCGPKKAKLLLDKFDSVENIVELLNTAKTNKDNNIECSWLPDVTCGWIKDNDPGKMLAISKQLFQLKTDLIQFDLTNSSEKDFLKFRVLIDKNFRIQVSNFIN